MIPVGATPKTMTPEEEERLEQCGFEAQSLVRARRYPEAEALARSIPTPAAYTAYLHEKVAAFTDLGRALLGSGERDHARGLLNEAETLAALMRDADWEEAYTLFDIGEIWRDAGDTDEAVRLWDACLIHGRGKDTLKLFARIYRELRSMGLHEKAEHVVTLVPRGYPLNQGSD